eukprot:4841370-Prymnesium_polylepis.1
MSTFSRILCIETEEKLIAEVRIWHDFDPYLVIFDPSFGHILSGLQWEAEEVVDVDPQLSNYWNTYWLLIRPLTMIIFLEIHLCQSREKGVNCARAETFTPGAGRRFRQITVTPPTLSAIQHSHNPRPNANPYLRDGQSRSVRY